MDLIEQKKIASSKFRRHPWELARFRILRFFLAKKMSGKFIADIGSGDAFIARMLLNQFPECKVAAIDIYYDQQFISENNESNLMFFKNIKDIPARQPVDVVLLMDVLEHIEKPQQLLYAIRELAISPSTQLVITVPAFQSLYTRHDTFLKHYRRYTIKQLNELLRGAGFNIQYSGYFFTSLWLARLFQKVFSGAPKHGLHDWKYGAFTTAIIATLLWTDFKISWYLSRIGIILPGLSCYCICHPLPS
jgi:hypothetical protein